MSDTPVSLLLVEDDPAHIEAIRRALEKGQSPCEIRHAATLRECLDVLAQTTPDLVMADLNMADGKAFELLKNPPESQPFPVLVITSHGDEKTAVQALKSGALDYVVKSEKTFAEMPHIVERAIHTWRHIQERARAEAALRKSEDRLRQVMDATNDGVWDWDLRTNQAFFSERYYTMLDYEPGEFPANYENWRHCIHPDDLAKVEPLIQNSLATRTSGFSIEFRMRAKNGEWKWIHGQGNVVERDEAGNAIRMVGTHEDITGRKKAETERLEMERSMLHSQKLESLGVLAGGIAHDFNNLLMAILGNLDLAMEDLSPVSSARASLEQAILAARRAGDLTRQMLAYSGKGQFLVKELDLSELVEENAHMLKAAISKLVTLNLQLDSALAPILADAGQIQQIVMNLITNASEAIGGQAGVVTLSTGAKDYDSATLGRSRLDLKPPAGRYAWIEVSDTGCGMDEDIRNRIFDPFFTTKFTGRGLGMSAVLGIVRGHGGAIFVDSQPGQGTTIRVAFPIVAQTGDPERKVGGLAPLHAGRPGAAGSGAILVVDDEPLVLSLARRMLERIGYDALTASNGKEAIRVFGARASSIAGVIVDLSMPAMDGLAVIRALRELRPGAVIVLSSGYDQAEATQNFAGQGLSGFIQKPYQLHELQEELARVLAKEAGKTRSAPCEEDKKT